FLIAVNSGVYAGSMDDKASFPVQKTSFPPQPAVKTSFNEKDRSISATYSPQPWDFDHTGAVPIWKFLQLTSLQWMDMHRHWFTPPKGGPPFADLFFGRCLLLEFSRSFHDQVFPGCSLPYSMRICKIGKTSIVFKQQIFDTSGKQVIAEDYKHCVSASSKTRRSEPWAAWLAQRYPDLCDAPPVATVEPFGPIAVEPSFVYTMKVAPSDTELYRHVGNYQYVRYCCDCVSFGAEKGAYSIITGDMAQYKIKRVGTLHKGEARAGDVLTVSSWEDPEHPDLIKFQIRKGEYNIAQCTLQFFTSNSKM
ncbi:Hypp2956, partial [Branchiostoma lanceolatum]